MAVMWIIKCEKWWLWTIWYIIMARFYAPFITEATPQVTMALRSERAMVRFRQKKGGTCTLRKLLVLQVEGLARVSKHAEKTTMSSDRGV